MDLQYKVESMALANIKIDFGNTRISITEVIKA